MSKLKETKKTKVVAPYSNLQPSPLGPQKDKNYPKIKSNLNVRIQGIIQNESFSTTWVDPKTVLEPHIEPKNSPLGPRKSKMTPKSCQNWKKQRKQKLLHYINRFQNNLNLIPIIKIAYFYPKKAKKRPLD